MGNCIHIDGYGEARECVNEIIWYFSRLIASRIGIDSALSRFKFRNKKFAIYELNALVVVVHNVPSCWENHC